MVLEDFFTLTEMNNGLTAPIRVRELLTAMEKHGDSIVKNVGDATRQWSAVANTIASTENKECLDLFVQLDGLEFMDKWLKDAKKFSSDTNESVLEESITHLLGALEKLHVDNVKLVSHGIWMTVKDLLGHNSTKVQDRAKTLFDRWTKDIDGDATFENVKGVGESTDEMRHNQEKCQELTRDDPESSTGFDALQPDKVEDALASERTLDKPTVSDSPSDRVSSPSSSKTANEIIYESHSACGVNQTPDIDSFPQKVGSLEESRLLEGRAFPSVSGAAFEINSAIGPNLQNLANAAGVHSDQKVSSSDGGRTSDTEGGTVDDGGCDDQRSNQSASRIKDGDDFNTNVLQKFNERSSENIKDSRTFSTEIEDGCRNSKLDYVTSQSDNLANVTLEYGMLDPPKVAGQVSMEVKREVDFREISCSLEGSHGWKGSAATNSLQPASSRHLDIDLNVAEIGDDRGYLQPVKQALVSFHLPYVESLVKANSRMSHHFELNLNHTSEDGDVPLHFETEGPFFAHSNDQSNASSSSKQPALENIDLNAKPSIPNDLYHSYFNESPQNLNGFADDINLALGMRSSLPYIPTVFGYNGHSAGPAMPVTSTIYGAGDPIPYMMDPRGAHILPQIMGSASPFRPDFTQLPFIASMTGSSTSNGVGPSRSCLDLNSTMEEGSKNPAAWGLFLGLGQSRSVDEQLRSNSQPLTSSVSEKRKEPEGGWEHYPSSSYRRTWKQSE